VVKKPLIVIWGPTAVGKTSLAISMAQVLNAEIISADSRQIYKYMDIGTAKPTLEQQNQAKHHLIDVVNPDENLSVAQYQQMAYLTIDEVHQRGSIPLMVGGTGQYITAVLEGWTIPEVPANTALRQELEDFATKYGSENLHHKLRTFDPCAADKIDHQNVRRVIRALEVYYETGQPISKFQQKHPPPYSTLCIGITLDRELLYTQANQRVDEMMRLGFVNEVQTLLGMGYSRHLPSMSGIGYKQIAAHLVDGISLDEATASTKHATHDFIRRQYTWFRGHDPSTLWHNMSESIPETIINQTVRWVEEKM
jgi:tRNA dimethylallyltransferase